MKTKIILGALMIGILAVTISAMTFKSDVVLQDLQNQNVEASANIKNSEGLDRLDSVTVRIKIKNLETMPNTTFEGWLVDLDSGYMLSMGAFKTNKAGKKNFLFEQDMTNFDIYDKIVITREQIGDINPNPNESVLEGNIPKELMTMDAEINGTNEVPSVITNASGNGIFTINLRENTLNFNITFANLTENETGAHIHGPAVVGDEANVLFTLPAGDPKIGTWNYPQSAEEWIIDGMTYVNIHTNAYPDGEIRGQIKTA